MRVEQYDIVVIGGSLGGVLAAYSAVKSNKKVVLTEETDWIGGQLTSQAVPPDEHPWIEQFGCTRTYREFRNEIREYYRKYYPLKSHAYHNIYLNPGNSSVSRITHEPKVSLKLLYDMLEPYISSKRLTIYCNYRPVDAKVQDDEVKSVKIKNTKKENEIVLKGSYFIDGTDLGDLLPLTGTEYVTGAESRENTKEPHALIKGEPLDMQPITHVAAVDYIEGSDFTIKKPEMYDYFKKYIPRYSNYSVLSQYGPDSATEKPKKFGIFNDEGIGLFPLWSYRRIIDTSNFENGFFEGDITLINWPQNDYFMGTIFDLPENEVVYNKEAAKQLTLSLIYWLQREKGFKGIRLRGDVLGTDDGLAKYPYIREGRRIISEYRVAEQEISKRYTNRIAKYKDTVGVGCYHIDLHITTVTNRFYYDNSYPFEIPLGIIIPIRVKNLIPASKNIGTTHLTNGCFRLHPVEWNIGEVAGYLCSMAIDIDKTPKEIRNNNDRLKAFQSLLIDKGIELHWPVVDWI